MGRPAAIPPGPWQVGLTVVLVTTSSTNYDDVEAIQHVNKEVDNLLRDMPVYALMHEYDRILRRQPPQPPPPPISQPRVYHQLSMPQLDGYFYTQETLLRPFASPVQHIPDLPLMPVVVGSKGEKMVFVLHFFSGRLVVVLLEIGGHWSTEAATPLRLLSAAEKETATPSSSEKSCHLDIASCFCPWTRRWTTTMATWMAAIGALF